MYPSAVTHIPMYLSWSGVAAVVFVLAVVMAKSFLWRVSREPLDVPTRKNLPP